jgi:S1-C subfamily serine protease
MATDLAAQLISTCVRLEGLRPDGSASVGTGFYMSLAVRGDRYSQVIVTNKHVIRDVEILKLSLPYNLIDKTSTSGVETITIGQAQTLCTYHPDKSVDLATINISGTAEYLFGLGKKSPDNQL